MTYGIQAFDASGALMWDSSTAVGGVAGDYRKYAAGAAGEVINYPQWAGLAAMIVDCGNGEFTSLDMSAGYPIVTVTSPTEPIAFALVVY